MLTPGHAQGILTTSIVVFSFFLFLRELWRQLLNALFDLQDEQDDEQAGVEPDAIGDPEGASSDGGSVHEHWDDGSGRNGAHLLQDAPLYDGNGNGNGGAHLGNGEHEPEPEPEPEAYATNDDAGPSESTPPPPSWVSRLAAPREA